MGMKQSVGMKVDFVSPTKEIMPHTLIFEIEEINFKLAVLLSDFLTSIRLLKI